MNRFQFDTLAEQVLHGLVETLEEASDDEIVEVDCIEGKLVIDLKNGTQFVINKHLSSQELWVDSPLSGSSHFGYIESSGEWIDPDGHGFYDILQSELEEIIGINILPFAQ